MMICYTKRKQTYDTFPSGPFSPKRLISSTSCFTSALTSIMISELNVFVDLLCCSLASCVKRYQCQFNR